MTTCAAELEGDPELFAARMVPDAPHLAKIERDIFDHALPSSSRPDFCLGGDCLCSERSGSRLSEESSRTRQGTYRAFWASRKEENAVIQVTDPMQTPDIQSLWFVAGS
jgi:hypothetical protein